MRKKRGDIYSGSHKEESDYQLDFRYYCLKREEKVKIRKKKRRENIENIPERTARASLESKENKNSLK